MSLCLKSVWPGPSRRRARPQPLTPAALGNPERVFEDQITPSTKSGMPAAVVYRRRRMKRQEGERERERERGEPTNFSERAEAKGAEGRGRRRGEEGIHRQVDRRTDRTGPTDQPGPLRRIRIPDKPPNPTRPTKAENRNMRQNKGRDTKKGG